MKNWMLWLVVGVLLAAAFVGTVSRQVDVRDTRTKGSIVSLAPNVTEIIFALGLEDRLMGVSTACDFPPQARDIRKVGDLGSPKLELLYALKPELVISTDLRDAEMAVAIRQSGAKLLTNERNTPEGLPTIKQDTLEGVLESIEIIGEAAGVPERAKAYADALRERIKRATVSVPDSARPRVFIEFAEQPLHTAAAGSFLDDLIYRAGGKNIAHDLGSGWTIISPDAVVSRDPQIIIVAHMLDGDARTVIGTRLGWGGVSAVKTGWIITDLDPDPFLRPGPRLADGLEALAALFAEYREKELK